LTKKEKEEEIESQYTCKKIADIVNFPFGVRDFIYLKEEQIVIVVLRDEDIVKRIDKFCVNLINLPWESNEFKDVALGVLMVGKININPGKTTFDTSWCQPFKQQVK